MYKGFMSNGYPVLNIKIDNHSVEVIVDTGFNGELMLPEPIIENLKLDCVGDETYRTASGDVVNTSFYFAYLKWFKRNRKVGVLATKGKSALLGMGLLLPYTLVVSASENKVEIY